MGNHIDIKIKEEIANTVTHGIGTLLGFVFVPLLVSVATYYNGASQVIGVMVYGFTFLLMFLSSTLYHSFGYIKRLKKTLKIIDHISIYFLIAGTYTPFILIYFLNPTGITLLCVLWGLALIGIVFKVFFVGKYETLSNIIYLLMGWSVLIIGKTFFTTLPTASMVLVAVGGGLYTLGVLFYVWHKLPFHHSIWHLFVLAASICHFVAVFLVVQ